MSSTTIYMTAGTWYKDGNSSNHSSDSCLKSWVPYAEGTPGVGAILQFAFPSSLKYKRITSAVLHFYTKWYINGYESSTEETGVKTAAYVIPNSAISLVNGTNLETYGQIGEYIVTEPFTRYGGSGYPRWRTADVTSIFRSNLYNDEYFSVILKCAPGYTDNTYVAIASSGTSYPAYLVLEYEDVAQLPPTPSYPNGVYINENTDILFSWGWNSSTAAYQTAVQLEYKLKSGSTWTVVNLTQTNHTYKLTGGLAQGVYEWRIKGTNDAGETSDYSSVAEFTVIGKPAAPVINTPANKALTEITWQATDQNSYDITLTDSDGNVIIDETVASSVSSYKPNMFLKGTYSVGIRYRNSTGLSSEWSYKAFSITASGPTKPTMTLFVDGPKVTVDFTPATDTNYYLIRQPNGGKEELAQDPAVTALGRFTDNTYKFFVPYRYVLRAYAGAGYSDSDPVRINHGLTAIVLETDDDELILSKSEEEYLPYEEDATGETAIYNVVGRDYPVVEHGVYDNWKFTSALYVSEEQKEKLKVMAKKNEIYYRDYSGRGFPVAIQAVNFVRWRKEGYIATIQFVRVAGEELIINV